MNFQSKRGELFYGYVKGTSMWPELIPGDILRAVMMKAERITPGDIIVISHTSQNPVVHRCTEKRSQDDNSIILRTAGDRGGSDSPGQMNPEEEFLKVTGVLRNGSWKSPRRKPFTHSSAVPDCIVSLHCRVVRKFFW